MSGDAFARIPDGTVLNFETLKRAIRANDAVLLSAKRIADNSDVVLICAARYDEEHDEITMTPFAEMVSGDPYAQYIPCTQEADDAGDGPTGGGVDPAPVS